jgi:pimeloyl-ACP methyl ester carboxylesterase
MAEVAKELAMDFGIIESFHTALTIQDQFDELKSIVSGECSVPVCLVGFSWGAWLCLLFGMQHRHLVGQLVLIGCGPLEAKYSAEIFTTRLSRLNTEEKHLFKTLLNSFEDETIEDKNSAFRELANLTRKTDTFHATGKADKNMEIFPEVFTSIWKEAEKLRKNGTLIAAIKNTVLPIHILHGAYDPHPVSGIIKPLQLHGSNFRYEIMERCGHKPWIEKHARTRFFNLLREIINQ